MRIRGGVVLALLGASACVPALHKPQPPPELTEVPTGSPQDVDRLLGQAQSLFDRQEPATVREAVEAWLEAAASDPTRDEGVIGATRARIWLADHGTDPKERLEAATSAVNTAQWCGQVAPNDPACSYWLGVALGVQARERPSTGLSALPRITEAFRRAAAETPLLDDAGPDRALALLLVRAPGWPTGPGNPEEALIHARRAVDLKPDYPPNLLALAEALKANGDETASRDRYSRALQLARQAATAGERDATEWISEAEAALAAHP